MIHVIGPNYKAPDGATIINTTSRSSTWSSGLSPFFCGPVDLYDGYVSKNVENGWQFSKLYEYYANEAGDPEERYFKWAQTGWNDTRAHRYPMGKGVIPLCSYWAGEKLSYVDARKKIYIPLYSAAVKKTSAYKQLVDLYNKMPKDEVLYLWDFDAHSLLPGTFDYWQLWDNQNIKVGHAYVLAMMLEGLI
jgi:hypothetical protein